MLIVSLPKAPSARCHSTRTARLLERALALAPTDGDVLAVAAAIREEMGDREAAIRLVVRALEAGYSQWEIDHDPAPSSSTAVSRRSSSGT
jgi:hypothetical protein